MQDSAGGGTGIPGGRRKSALDELLPLRPAELILLANYRRGIETRIGEGRPKEQSADNVVRAPLIRFLALGGDEDVRGHAHGVELRGACIEGILDLESAPVAHRLALRDCVIDSISAAEARLKTLDLSGSHLKRGLWARACRCEGELKLGGGFHGEGGVRLNDATIESLDCQKGLLENPDGRALDCVGLTALGNVRLGSGFRAKGAVDFEKARISGDLDCFEGRIDNPGKDALYLNYAEIKGSLRLDGKFVAVGRVALAEATIGGNLYCSSGTFQNDKGIAIDCHRTRISGSAYLGSGLRATGRVTFFGASIGNDLTVTECHLINPGDDALNCSEAKIAGALTFDKIAQIDGAIWMVSAQAGSLWDDAASWSLAAGHYSLDGFTYARLGGGSPVVAADRIAWLEGQSPPRDPRAFRPQPWEQLMGTLRAMGHPNEARIVAIAKHRRERKAGRWFGNSRILDWLYGALLGYGYRPSRLLLGLAAVWLSCAAAYWFAAHPEIVGARTHLLAPAERQDDPACLADRAAAASSAECPKQPPRYEDFNALVYSADVLLPVLSLGYKDEWQPVIRDAGGAPLPLGRALRLLYWLEIALGWLAGLQLVGLLGNLIKKE